MCVLYVCGIYVSHVVYVLCIGSVYMACVEYFSVFGICVVYM